MRPCARCKAPANGNEHHLIPKFLFEYYELNGNPDDYRIVLCESCHDVVTTMFENVRLGMLKKITHDELDTLIEGHYGVGTMNVIWEYVTERQRKEIPVWLNHIIMKGAHEGRRHVTRYVIMVNMHARGFSDEEIAITVMKFNKRCPKPVNDNILRLHIKNTLKRLKR